MSSILTPDKLEVERHIASLDKKYPVILSQHDTILKLLSDRTEYINKWLAHVKADPDKHSIIQLPVPWRPLFSLYVLVNKSDVSGMSIDRDYLAKCPSLLVQQSVAAAGVSRYPCIRAMQSKKR